MDVFLEKKLSEVLIIVKGDDKYVGISTEYDEDYTNYIYEQKEIHELIDALIEVSNYKLKDDQHDEYEQLIAQYK